MRESREKRRERYDKAANHAPGRRGQSVAHHRRSGRRPHAEGGIATASGQKLEGVTVYAKMEGSTVTTSVYTDESGSYYFPPLPAGKAHRYGRRRSASKPREAR